MDSSSTLSQRDSSARSRITGIRLWIGATNGLARVVMMVQERTGSIAGGRHIITAGHGNETGRQIAIREGEGINARALTAMFREIVAHNRAGGWRKLKGARPSR